MLFPAVALLAHMGESVPAEGATALARLAAFVLSPRKVKPPVFVTLKPL